MAVTYSVTATVTRATQFGRNEFRKIGLTSGSEATKEFAADVDLTDLTGKTFPILVLTPDINIIRFLIIQVTGGTASIRLVKNNTTYETIDQPLSGTMILSGVELKSAYVLGTPTGTCFVSIFGLGS